MNYLLKTSQQGNFHFDPATWAASANTKHDWKYKISRVHVSPGSAQTLPRRGWITDHRSIGYSLRNISAKNYRNRLMCVEVIVCNISVIFETQCITCVNGNMICLLQSANIKTSLYLSFIPYIKKLVPCGTDGRRRLSGLQAVVTLTLYRVIRHTVMHQSSTSYLYTKCHWNRKNFFVDRLTTATPKFKVTWH